MVEIQVDRGTGWQLLAYDTTPGTEDTAPFPAQLTKWKYRMIFRTDDDRFGEWSAEISVTVRRALPGLFEKLEVLNDRPPVDLPVEWQKAFLTQCLRPLREPNTCFWVGRCRHIAPS